MSKNRFNFSEVKPIPLILGPLTLGLWVSHYIPWLGWALMLFALIMFGFRASIKIGALTIGLFFAGLSIFGATLIWLEPATEGSRWALLLGTGSISIFVGLAVWSRHRFPGAALMTAGIAISLVAFPPAITMVAGMALAWVGVFLLHKLSSNE